MKSCELCEGTAKIYCESDRANLCLNCDAKVHLANFLVARHSRCLLCHVCHSPTSWSASGANLGFAVSVCESCFAETRRRKQEAEESQGEICVGEGGCRDDEDDSGDDDGDEEEDDEISSSEDIQVVPWSSTTPPPPPPANSSSCENSLHGRDEEEVSSKRLRENDADACSNDDRESSLSTRITRPMKIRKRENGEMGRFG